MTESDPDAVGPADSTTAHVPAGVGGPAPSEHGYDDDAPRLSADDQATVDALPPASALLLALRGPNAGARFLLDSDETSVGRHPGSDIFLDDVTVSRRHAVFARGVEDFVVRDVGSLNGTYVNRTRIDEATLSNGDEIQVGKFRLHYFRGRQ